ncbi:DUF1822 family protein [Desertifilum sp. FACHB-1129]|uniref:DUF1822 family protein n=1 Tax=unclassified Desertifilum TaxID=2621682 RepID=UPI0016859958|nr:MULTISPECIES: DUF1822 family protein [unclassified Desertifilum]MBD2311082.1 DUF1822 family protein [Desertifilum sp. FACHB-1129]MBD2323949.1 DUF1822 family protein [Desertifilum sp. FACHB-866]MBD2333884.1 DUF1822 family protein [Desertifilum sp. FACHB-868]MDA0211195.1 DUF1822 family protein [Cyanobacteria bacterium FC1]
MNNLLDTDQLWIEFTNFPDTVELDEDKIQKAIELSDTVANTTRKWQVYLQALALFSFEEWLQQREPGIAIQKQSASTFQPQYANVIDAVCHLQVGEFQVCLIPTLFFSDEAVTFPRAIVDLPEFADCFYIVIALSEDLGLAATQGFLRYDQLLNYKTQLQAEMDWTYQLPLSWFNREPDQLLLYLQCLEPAAIALPEIPANRQATLARMQAAIFNLLPQLNHRPLWQGLTWEQGIAVLTTPDLLHWLSQSFRENLSDHLSDLLQILTQRAINVRHWLGNLRDEVMQEMFWELLPASSPLRRSEASPVRDLDEILAEISRIHQLEIPAIAVRAYRDITLEHRLRLFVVTCPLPETQEWMLLLILQAIPGDRPTHNITLRISDRIEVLAEEALQPDMMEDYIFIQVVGDNDDRFLATITSATGSVQSLPPFEFSPD